MPNDASSSDSDTVRAIVQRQIVSVLSNVLDVPTRDLHPGTPYTELGVDSILAVDTSDRLNKALGIKLRSTDLFNYVTIRALTDHIVESFGDAIDVPAPDDGTDAASTDDATPAPTAQERDTSPRETSDVPPRRSPAADQSPSTDRRASDESQTSVSANDLFSSTPSHEPPPVPPEDASDASTREPSTREPSTREPSTREPSAAKSPPSKSTASTPSQETPAVHTAASGPRDRSDAREPQGRDDTPAEIAIVGMAGRFPDADDVDTFWEQLAAGHDAVREITRWPEDDYFHPDPRHKGTSYSKWGAQLDDIDRFDPLFFSISPKEAEQMDPQHRMFLEEAWRAFEDAGYSDAALQGTDCGVFVGCTEGDYRRTILASDADVTGKTFSGTSASILAARISYLLDLKGPSVPVDTACSSSLVALHLACESLRSGDSEMALAGGVAISTTPEYYIFTSQSNMLSPTGRCHTFDDGADGFVPGEAAGAVVLKRLDAAVRDGDPIHAVIAGSAVNQDGKTNGITAPSGPSQVAVLRKAYERHAIDPEQITYVEAHGTGTHLGDPIEVQSLTDAFRESTDRTQYCALGSVKTNVGHTGTAAGLTSLVKVIQQLKHQQLAPSLHLQRENEHVDFDDSPFFVNTTLRRWQPPSEGVRHAGVSSFGFSGTNAHVVVREAPPTPDRNAPPPHEDLIVLSAKTETSLRQRARDLADWVEREAPRLDDVAYTLQAGRSHFAERVALVAQSTHGLARRLRTFASDGVDAASNVHRGSGQHLPPEDQSEVDRLVQRLAASGPSDASRRDALDALARLYARGGSWTWDRLFDATDARRVSMPGYPFDRDSYWVVPRGGTASDATPAAANRTDRLGGAPTTASATAAPHAHRLHPLVGRNTSTLSEHRFTTRFHPDEAVVADHVVEGRPLMPGVVSLEMARAAGEEAAERRVTALHDVVWRQPLPVDGPVDVSVTLTPRDTGVDFEVWTPSAASNATSNRTVHTEGRIRYDTAPSLDTVDLDAIRRRCPETTSADDVYAAFRSIGFDYGPAFRGIVALRHGPDAVLATVAAPETDRDAYGDGAPPSLLDAALQSTLWLFGGISGGGASGDGATDGRPLPFGIDRVHRGGTLPERCFAYVTPAAGHSALAKYDVRLVDEAGTVRLAMNGYSARTQSAPSGASSGDEDVFDLFRQVENHTLDPADAAERIKETGGFGTTR